MTQEKEQQITQLKSVNEKLLRKYIIVRTKGYRGFPAFSLLLLYLGVFLISVKGLNWSIIVSILFSLIIGLVYFIIIRLPLSKGNLSVTPIQKLKPTLLKYRKLDIIGTTIFLLIITATLIWLAIELYSIYTIRFWFIEIDNRVGKIAYQATILITLIIILSTIISTYQDSDDIGSLVADIDEFNPAHDYDQTLMV